MLTASDVLPENSRGPAVTKPEVTNIETTANLDEEEDVAAPVQSYAEYVDPAKSSKRFGLKGSAPFRPPKGKSPLCANEIGLIERHQAMILSTMKKSIQ